MENGGEGQPAQQPQLQMHESKQEAPFSAERLIFKCIFSQAKSIPASNQFFFLISCDTTIALVRLQLSLAPFQMNQQGLDKEDSAKLMKFQVITHTHTFGALSEACYLGFTN